jgi:hypothetical protein
VQVGEERLTRAQPGVLGGDGLLDLEQQLGLGPDLVGRGDDARTDARVGIVADARTDAGALLDQHLVPPSGQLVDAGQGDGDAVLVVLDFRGDSDEHADILVTSASDGYGCGGITGRMVAVPPNQR